MKLPLIALATLTLTTAAALAQPPGHGRGGFGLLANDANADGKLTKAEFDAAQRTRFNQVDANKDGSATPEEFKTFHEVKAQEMHAEMSKARFAALDTDKNGQISEAEMQAHAGSDKGPGKGFHGGRDGHRGHGMGRGGRHGP